MAEHKSVLLRESIEYLVHLFADEPLDALWKEMTGNE